MTRRTAIGLLSLIFVPSAWASSTEEAKKKDKPKPPQPPKPPGKPKKGDAVVPEYPGDDNVDFTGHIRFPKVQ